MNRKNQTLRYESISDIQQKVQPKDAYLYIYLYFANNNLKKWQPFSQRKQKKNKNKMYCRPGLCPAQLETVSGLFYTRKRKYIYIHILLLLESTFFF